MSPIGIDVETIRPRHFRWDVAGRVATVTLNRPERKNPLTFDSYVGSVRLRYGLTRIAAPFVEYLYYFYDFRGGAQQLPADVPSRLERNGIRAGLTLWIPLLRR